MEIVYEGCASSLVICVNLALDLGSFEDEREFKWRRMKRPRSVVSEVRTPIGVPIILKYS